MIETWNNFLFTAYCPREYLKLFFITMFIVSKIDDYIFDDCNIFAKF